MDPRNPAYLLVLKKWFKIQELQARYFAIDYHDPDCENGGFLWSRIDILHGEIIKLLED